MTCKGDYIIRVQGTANPTRSTKDRTRLFGPHMVSPCDWYCMTAQYDWSRSAASSQTVFSPGCFLFSFLQNNIGRMADGSQPEDRQTTRTDCERGKHWLSSHELAMRSLESSTHHRSIWYSISSILSFVPTFTFQARHEDIRLQWSNSLTQHCEIWSHGQQCHSVLLGFLDSLIILPISRSSKAVTCGNEECTLLHELHAWASVIDSLGVDTCLLQALYWLIMLSPRVSPDFPLNHLWVTS